MKIQYVKRLEHIPMFYKVLRTGNLSCVIENQYQVQYLENEWVYPKIGKLFAFNNLIYAKFFAKHQRSGYFGTFCTYIYECKVLNPTEIKLISISLGEYQIKDFWERPYEYPLDHNTTPPPGTISCDAIKLGKFVVKDE